MRPHRIQSGAGRTRFRQPDLTPGHRASPTQVGPLDGEPRKRAGRSEATLRPLESSRATASGWPVRTARCWCASRRSARLPPAVLHQVPHAAPRRELTAEGRGPVGSQRCVRGRQDSWEGIGACGRGHGQLGLRPPTHTIRRARLAGHVLHDWDLDARKAVAVPRGSDSSVPPRVGPSDPGRPPGAPSPRRGRRR
jgi:hypothetical protein